MIRRAATRIELKLDDDFEELNDEHMKQLRMEKKAQAQQVAQNHMMQQQQNQQQMIGQQQDNFMIKMN